LKDSLSDDALENNLVGWKRLSWSIFSGPGYAGAFAAGDESGGDESLVDESLGDDSLGDENFEGVLLDGDAVFGGECLAFLVGDGDKSRTLSFMELLLRVSLMSFGCLAGDIKVF
jgi:hypothetical protein